MFDLVLPVKRKSASRRRDAAPPHAMLIGWREDVVRDGTRVNGKATTKPDADLPGCHNKAGFCDRCHAYSGFRGRTAGIATRATETAMARSGHEDRAKTFCGWLLASWPAERCMMPRFAKAQRFRADRDRRLGDGRSTYRNAGRGRWLQRLHRKRAMRRTTFRNSPIPP